MPAVRWPWLGSVITRSQRRWPRPGGVARRGAAGLAGARDAGDLWNLGNLLEKMVVLDLSSARFQDAAEHLREGLQTALRTGSRARVLDDLDCCGYLCALTGRRAEAVTLWAAVVVVQGHQGFSVPSHPDRACQIFCVSWGSRCPFVTLLRVVSGVRV